MEDDLLIVTFAIERKYEEEFDKFFNETLMNFFKCYPITEFDVLKSFLCDRGD